MADTQPLAPTDAEIEALGHRMCWRYKHSADPHHSSTYTLNRTTLLDFSRAVLAKWGAQPVAREPLTDEHLRVIERMHVYAHTATLMDFARAIERAHGITTTGRKDAP